MPPTAFLHPQNAPKSLGLTVLPRPPSWIKGPNSKGREKRRGKRGRKGRGRYLNFYSMPHSMLVAWAYTGR